MSLLTVVSMLQHAFVFVLRINFILTPLKKNEGSNRRECLLKKDVIMPICSRLAEPGGKNQGFKGKVSKQVCNRLAGI